VETSIPLWGGIECTLNRVGDRRSDQLELSGHYARGDDLARIAALGIKTLRYPLLWERAINPTEPEKFDWRFADERLSLLQLHGITPVAGLVHHGSGPDGMDLLSDSFAEGLAAYAGQLARRFPWLELYTPVNEPLTTARFCGLYGHWHPHGLSDRDFARMLVNECRATVLAMRAIREANPLAKLVQTEDLGTIYSTGRLAYQAEFENRRRWLAWDLLCGYVHRAHSMYGYLRSCGLTKAELAWFCENPCPPDIIGIDHYVTSDRFLDENVQRYPPSARGGNGRDIYADVEAVRVLERPGTSLRHVIQDAWRRYRIPIVLTEVHIGCSEGEQIRWLGEALTTCTQLAASGVDVRAATAWALLGSFDWDSLLTLPRGSYEAGAFDLKTGQPRATALAEYIRARIAGETSVELRRILAQKGWWQRADRLTHGAEYQIASLVA
jgi:dTDP-4-dehydrorhamnose reductase